MLCWGQACTEVQESGPPVGGACEHGHVKLKDVDESQVAVGAGRLGTF